MSININNAESADLGQAGPFALSYNAKKDRLYAKADDISMYCSPLDAPRHVESFPALAEAFSRLVHKEMHDLMCPIDHEGDEGEEGSGDIPEGLKRIFEQMEDDAREGFKEQEPEMPQALKDVLKGLARSIVTDVAVPKGTPEEDLPGRPASEAPEGVRSMLEQIAKDLGVSLDDVRIVGNMPGEKA